MSLEEQKIASGPGRILGPGPGDLAKKHHYTWAYSRWTKDEKVIVYHASPSLDLYTLENGSTAKVSTNDGADFRYPCCEATPK